MAARKHQHWVGGPDCDLPTKKACDDRYADWQAMQQVLLAREIVLAGRAKAFRKDTDVFGQLVLVIAGQREDITTKEGNASVTPWVNRLRAAIARVIAGDVPAYNLVTPTGV